MQDIMTEIIAAEDIMHLKTISCVKWKNVNSMQQN